eukprot:CAMPEP_0119151854 /NCGR_PEP_ID=MMETSP1310-20130426/46910_1 /TAXON_ID=464262 /ORGANISM="Genus nov. species nov., Strain RCC2339" /LENGTH=72 /DNA_ID=CAMNT_0007144163 /DNA_START=1 /DNA_END=215 /DNA_ORIENTATION=+
MGYLNRMLAKTCEELKRRKKGEAQAMRRREEMEREREKEKEKWNQLAEELAQTRRKMEQLNERYDIALEVLG